MEGFSYNNIFETKGIEYLIIITFLVLIIPFWLIINRRSAKKTSLRQAGVFTSGILKIPHGIFYSKNHTWAFLERSGIARVGLNDFLTHATGEVKITELKTEGTFIKKGDPMGIVDQFGKHLKVFSPLSGVITATNFQLTDSPRIVNDDPYGNGWFYKIKPAEWKADTGSYYLGEEADAWLKEEVSRLKDFLAQSTRIYSPETSAIILQDGGEFCDNPLRELPDEVWQNFQKSFLN
jgi:glycine cleavage system H protein